jgi:hypothetical protein
VWENSLSSPRLFIVMSVISRSGTTAMKSLSETQEQALRALIQDALLDLGYGPRSTKAAPRRANMHGWSSLMMVKRYVHLLAIDEAKISPKSDLCVDLYQVTGRPSRGTSPRERSHTRRETALNCEMDI